MKKEMTQRLHNYDKYESIETDALIKKIINGLGREIRPVQIATLIRKTIMEDPLIHIVEPYHFIDRLKIMKSAKSQL